MGTRGFVGFVIDGTEKIAYNHYDSYPEGLGAAVLVWLHSRLTEAPARFADADAVLVRLREQAWALRVVDPETEPSAEDIQRLGQYADLNVSTQTETDWYCLLRKTQGNPELILRAGVTEDAGDFPMDPTSAEWGYVVDLDAEVFEVYKGHQRDPHERGRFASREALGHGYPAALVATWPLRSLPGVDEFVTAVSDAREWGT